MFGTALLTVVAAIFFHLSIIRQDIEFLILHLGVLYIAVFCAITIVLSGHVRFTTAVVQTTGLAVVFNTTLMASVLAHRLFFHRIRKFPGPVGARVSKLWQVHKVWGNLRAYQLFDKAHKEYGDFVRIGPRELSINHVDAISQIYGADLTKGPFYGNAGADSDVNLFLVREKKLHALRRTAWDRSLNGPALSSYEAKVVQVTTLLINKLTARAGTPVDISRWFRFLSFDVMGEIGLGKSYGMLESDKMHPAVTGLVDGQWYFGIFGAIPWAIRLLFSIPGAGGQLVAFQRWCQAEMSARIKGLQADQKPNDIASHLLVDKKSGLGKIPYEATLDDFRLIVIAGSDTTSSSLTVTMFYLALNPAVYKKLQSILDSLFPNGDPDFVYSKSTSITYLDAVINESMRLQPAVSSTGGLTRITPTGGLMIAGVHVPGDVIVSVPPYTINRDPRYFDKAEEFIPERWTDEHPELVRDRGVLVPFSIGTYHCPGRALAYMEMRMVVARIALGFEVAFAEEGGGGFEEGMMDCFTRQVPGLVLKFTPRR